MQMPQTFVGNGSRYQARISDSETYKQTSVVIDTGDACVVPPAVESITIILQKEKDRKILKNWKVNDGEEGDKSIIITEDGGIQHGHRNDDMNDTDWMWKSSSNGKNHRPRKFFIANASGEVIKVQRVDRNDQSSTNSYVQINHGETETLDYGRVKITQHGHRNEDKADTDWMWKSSSNGKNHRPRKFFIANASGKVIKVQRVHSNGQSSKTSCVYINHGETETLNHDHVKITSLPYLLYRPFTDTEQEIFEGTVEPRTSVVVCDMSAKTTGRLYGEDIEANKWIVDGRDYKPTSVIDKEELYTLLYDVKTGACEFVNMVTSKVVAMLGERYKRYIGYGAL